MAITVPTKAQLRETLQATLKGLLPEIVVTKDSDVGARIDMLVEALFGVHFNVGRVQDDVFISDKTSSDALDLHADARFTGGRKGATLASGNNAVTATGTDGSTIDVGEQLTFEDGTEYQVTSGGIIVSGTATLSIEAITPGTVGNRDVGETLTFVSPPAGVNANATITVAIENGEDQETDAQLIVRLLDAFKNPPAGGRFSDYRQQAQAVEGVRTAYTYGPSSQAQTGRRGLGIVDVAILGTGTGTTRIPSVTVQNNVEDAIELLRPAATKEFGVLLPTAITRDVEADITPEPGSEFDWTKLSVVTIETYTAATRTAVLSDEVADFAGAGQRTLKVGDRVLVSVGNHSSSEINTIKSITDDIPSGKATVVFDDDFATDPASAVAENFEPAGPLTSGALERARDYFDSLGPGRGTGADPEQVWDDTLRVVNLACAILEEAGIKTVDITDPVGDVAALDPVTSPPQIIVYGELNLHPPLGT